MRQRVPALVANVIILKLTETTLRKYSFLQRAIDLVEGITGTDLDGDGVGRQENKIPTIDTNSQEIHIVIRTLEGGHNSGRSYVYRPEHERAQEWLELLLYSNKERHKKGSLDLKEEYESGVLYYRTSFGRFYESNAFQMWTACLIISGFSWTWRSVASNGQLNTGARPPHCSHPPHFYHFKRPQQIMSGSWICSCSDV